MHIGMDISRMARASRTGTEQYAAALLAALLRPDGPERADRYTLYCNIVPDRLPPLGGRATLRPLPASRLWTHARLSAEVMSSPPDLLFVPAHVLPLATPICRTMASVVTIHDLGYLRFPESHTRAQRMYLRLSTAWSARVATRVIAISEATKRDLVTLARVPPEKIDVVYHGVAPRFAASPERPEDRETGRQNDRETERPGDGELPGIHADWRRLADKLPAETQRSYLLYVGTLQPRKNLLRLLDAFADVLRRPGCADLELWLAGSAGWLSDPIVARANAPDLRERVRMLGYVPDAVLPALYGGALGFVFPSLAEGFGMPVLEAMAAGVPVLTSQTSSLPEAAGDAALLVNPLDTQQIAAGMARLATDAVLRQELRARGLRRAASFTWERCAIATRAVFARAAGSLSADTS